MDRKHAGFGDLGQEDGLNWEAFWNEHEAAIKDGLAAEMKPYFDMLAKHYPEEARQENLAEKLPKEKEFVKALLSKLKELLAQGKKVLMLVDVDETIGGGYYDEKQEWHTLIRPAFLAVMKRIQSYRDAGRLDVGLLTTRGIPREQLDDPNNLQKIKSYIHPDHIYSTRKYQTLGSTHEEIEEIGQKENGVLRAGLTEADYNKFSIGGSVVKLKALEDITAQNPTETILVVDDFKFVNYLNQDRNLHGVHIDEQAQFWVR